MLEGSDDVAPHLNIWPSDLTSNLFRTLYAGNLNEDTTPDASQSASHAQGRTDVLVLYRNLVEIFKMLADPNVKDNRKRAEAAVSRLATNLQAIDLLDLLPLSVAAPLREAARTCQMAPPPNWTINAYELIGRNELSEINRLNGEILFNDGYHSVKEHIVRLMSRPFGDD